MENRTPVIRWFGSQAFKMVLIFPCRNMFLLVIFILKIFVSPERYFMLAFLRNVMICFKLIIIIILILARRIR